jgi:hypothetical protein
MLHEALRVFLDGDCAAVLPELHLAEGIILAEVKKLQHPNGEEHPSVGVYRDVVLVLGYACPP